MNHFKNPIPNLLTIEHNYPAPTRLNMTLYQVYLAMYVHKKNFGQMWCAACKYLVSTPTGLNWKLYSILKLPINQLKAQLAKK